MMMRSVPPASSHLAERPVPAPPPTIGTCRRTMSWNFSRISPRSMRGIPSLSGCDLSKILHQRGGEFRVVDMEREADQPSPFRLLDSGVERLEQRRVGVGIVERLPRRVDRRNAFFRDQKAHIAFTAVQPLGDPFSYRTVLVR